MKAIAFFALAVLIVAVSCRPEQDLNALNAERARRMKACLHDCTGEEVKPICAGKAGQKPKSFGNQCALNNYNCKEEDTLSKVSNGQCPGSDGIRLS